MYIASLATFSGLARSMNLLSRKLLRANPDCTTTTNYFRISPQYWRGKHSHFYQPHINETMVIIIISRLIPGISRNRIKLPVVNKELPCGHRFFSKNFLPSLIRFLRRHNTNMTFHHFLTAVGWNWEG